MNTDPLAADFRNFLFLIWQHLNLPQPTNAQTIRLQNDIERQTEDQETAENCGPQKAQKEVTLRGPESAVESDLLVWTPSIQRGEKGPPDSPEDVFCGLPSDVEPSPGT